LLADRLPGRYPVITDDAQLDRVDHFSIVASPGGQNTRLARARAIFPDGLADGIEWRCPTGCRLRYIAIGAIGGRWGADLLLSRLICDTAGVDLLVMMVTSHRRTAPERSMIWRRFLRQSSIPIPRLRRSRSQGCQYHGQAASVPECR
jgi:hypothetical protein